MEDLFWLIDDGYPAQQNEHLLQRFVRPRSLGPSSICRTIGLPVWMIKV